MHQCRDNVLFMWNRAQRPKVYMAQFIQKSSSLWPPVCLLLEWRLKKLWTSSLTWFLRFWSELATEVVLIVKSALSMFQKYSVSSLILKKTKFCSQKMFLSLIRIDFAVRFPCRAVRIASRAVRLFPALSLPRVPPSYRAFVLMVFEENYTRTVRVIW